MYFLFPFHLIKKNSNIVLYGAGNAGKNFAKQIEITHHCNIVGVVDRNYAHAEVRNYKIHPVSWLEDAKYDTILITMVNERAQKEVYEMLLNIGISEDKIVSFISPAMDWDRPNRGYIDQKEEYEINKKLGNYLEEIDPSLLLTSERIDVIVRFLLFKDIMNNTENKVHQSLFLRFTMARGGGKESPSYFSGAGKNSLQEFLEKGRELCNNIKENGFDQSKFLPLGNHKRPYDGLHRMAAALAAGEKIYVHEYADRDALSCDIDWFKENGFSFEDQVRIVRGFSDIYPGKCGMFVLYAPFSNLWDYMEQQIALKFKKVASIDFHYEDNFIAFENVLRQIYWDWNHYSEWLTRKLDLLTLAPLKYRVIIVSDENKNDDFYKEIRELKMRMREALSVDVDGRIPIQMHSTDTEDEFNHLKKIFLSSNQYLWDMRKIQRYYRSWFLSALGKLKTWCSDNQICCDDVCVVGSSVLELYGIREAKNMNFIVKCGIEYNTEILDPDLEWKECYGIDGQGNELSNDVLITDPEYYTVFSDIKFCNPEFVYRRKKKLNREKDQIDIKKMDDWYQLIMGMDDRRFLNQQVERELYKRGLIK